MSPLSKKGVYDQQYAKDMLQRISIALNKEHDADILEWLGNKPNKQGYIKELIRADMEKNK